MKRRMPTFNTLDSDPSYHYADYKGHSIILQEPNSQSNYWDCWYIIVHGPDGDYCYDGGWPDSEDKTLEQAFYEACDGAMIP